MHLPKDPQLRKSVKRTHRATRVRAHLRGNTTNTARPRLTVFRSSRALYCQLIDDVRGRTLAHASTQDDEVRGIKVKKDRAFAVGKLIAMRAREKGIAAVVFDRGGFKYHGRVEALAKGAREGGLQF